MSGFFPFFTTRRRCVKQVLGAAALSFLNPFRLFARSEKGKVSPDNIQLFRKTDQYNALLFNDKFAMNKPVFPRQENVKPYSSLLYWSNGVARDTCAFSLHPHQGFEIMTFLFAGQIEHFDTTSKAWTTLRAGDFQVIQSNSGVQHQEKLRKNSRSFQIWFDPHFAEAVQLTPSYVDYRGQDFHPRLAHGIQTLTYVGPGSPATALTPGVVIKKLIFDQQTQTTLPLDPASSYTFYVLQGTGQAEAFTIGPDDALRIQDTAQLRLDFQGELFYVQTPTEVPYEVVAL